MLDLDWENTKVIANKDLFQTNEMKMMDFSALVLIYQLGM